MYITITIAVGGKRFNISIDERQTVSAAYAILKERGLTDGDAPILYKSLLKDEWIAADKPLKDAGILSGDLLTAQE